MNLTTNSIKSYQSASNQSNKSFRVLIKNRITREVVQPQSIKNTVHLKQLQNSLQSENFQQTKNTLKKYIKNMKTSTKFNHRFKTDTQRIQNQYPQSNQKLSTTRLKLIQSRKLGLKSHSSNDNYKKQLMSQQIAKRNNSSLFMNATYNNNHENNSIRRQLSQQNNQTINSNIIYPSYMKLNDQIFIKNENSSIIEDLNTTQMSSQRHRLSELERKIQSILEQKLQVLAKDSTNSTVGNKNIKVNKLLQKQIDRILEQIRKIKSIQQNTNQSIKIQDKQKQAQINKNIEMLEKKVKILQRLIAQKLFESDNIKNRYLQRLKQHKKHQSDISYSRNSKSSTFYMNSNTLNPSNFKPQPIKKSALESDMTTNRASFQKPLDSYYILPRKQSFYNNNSLNQPMPRSTYDRQYLIYGVIPKNLVSVRSNRRDHGIFNGKLSDKTQQNILKFSTYKQEFIKKIQRQPINFKQLDCYKDKFKSIQVNYGTEKDINKIVNDKSVIECLQQDELNPQNKYYEKNLPSISPRVAKNNSTNFKTRQTNKNLTKLLQSQHKVSNFEQEQIQKHHLFNQRIKSQIKHKNVYDQKFMFKRQLLNQMNKSINPIQSPLKKSQKTKQYKTIDN